MYNMGEPVDLYRMHHTVTYSAFQDFRFSPVAALIHDTLDCSRGSRWVVLAHTVFMSLHHGPR